MEPTKQKKNRKKKLPKKLLAIPNKDKEWHEKWTEDRDMLNIPHPFRAVLIGPPNVGKTTVILNMIIRATPQFEEIKVVHCDADFTKEYQVLGDDIEMLSEIPPVEFWSGHVKTLVIVDDLELKTLGKAQTKNLDRLFGFVSTHKNISIILTSQDAFQIPTIVRRCASLWILWKGTDRDSMNQLSRKVGYNKDQFERLFEMAPEFHDSLWIDKTRGSPYPLRLNGFEMIAL